MAFLFYASAGKGRLSQLSNVSKLRPWMLHYNSCTLQLSDIYSKGSVGSWSIVCKSIDIKIFQSKLFCLNRFNILSVNWSTNINIKIEFFAFNTKLPIMLMLPSKNFTAE